MFKLMDPLKIRDGTLLNTIISTLLKNPKSRMICDGHHVLFIFESALHLETGSIRCACPYGSQSHCNLSASVSS